MARMETSVFLAVLAAAALHAGWNAVVKVGLDRFSSVLLLALSQSALALALLPFFPAPAQAAWPWVGLAALLHSGYKVFLIRAYQHGELSEVYPIARGTAPLLVTLAGTFLFREALTPASMLGVAAIGFGVILMAGGGFGRHIPPPALAYALATACFTAAYTLADAHGARLARSASGFALWMFAGDGLAMLGYALATRGVAALPALLPAWRSGLAAGAMSLASYWIAIWAFTRAPVALVAALRETSVLFAMIIAIAFLGERPGARRWAAAALIGAGVVGMRLPR